jgi:hypothetical protein
MMIITRDKTKREPLNKATLGEDHNTSLETTSMNAKSTRKIMIHERKSPSPPTRRSRTSV